MGSIYKYCVVQYVAIGVTPSTYPVVTMWYRVWQYDKTNRSQGPLSVQKYIFFNLKMFYSGRYKNTFYSSQHYGVISWPSTYNIEHANIIQFYSFAFWYIIEKKYKMIYIPVKLAYIIPYLYV